MPSTWIATYKSLTDIETRIRHKLQQLTNTPLTVTQAYVLQALNDADGQQPTALAKYTGKPATSFTPILDVMEINSLIQRKAGKTDRRSVCIHLTEKGKSLAGAVVQVLAEVEAELTQ